MLHDLPEQPVPVCEAWWAMDERRWDDPRRLLHPQVCWTDRHGEFRGRAQVLDQLRAVPVPSPPSAIEVRDGQLYRWSSR